MGKNSRNIHFSFFFSSASCMRHFREGDLIFVGGGGMFGQISCVLKTRGGEVEICAKCEWIAKSGVGGGDYVKK